MYHETEGCELEIEDGDKGDLSNVMVGVEIESEGGKGGNEGSINIKEHNRMLSTADNNETSQNNQRMKETGRPQMRSK